MRILLIAAALLVSGCASAFAQDDPLPVWRQNTQDLERDRLIARDCIFSGSQDCDAVVQDACSGGDGGEGITSAVLRACDWRAIAAWEDEIEDMLARLRGSLRGRDLENLEASQTAWEASMLADVTVAMDLYQGGSLQGAVGANVRARALFERARYLAGLILQIGDGN